MSGKHLPRILVASALLGFNLGAGAARGTHDPGVNARQHHQNQRIRQGVKSGELTRSEAKGLREDQRDIRQLESAYKSDGKLTGAERRDLHHELNEQSREIHSQKHDGQQRQAGGTGVGNPGSGAAAAGPANRDPGVNARQRRQNARIRQGVASGELTRAEAQGLRQEQRDVRQLESAYKSDGKLTGAERRDLHHELNEAGSDIREQKHDAQQR